MEFVFVSSCGCFDWSSFGPQRRLLHNIQLLLEHKLEEEFNILSHGLTSEVYEKFKKLYEVLAQEKGATTWKVKKLTLWKLVLTQNVNRKIAHYYNRSEKT